MGWFWLVLMWQVDATSDPPSPNDVAIADMTFKIHHNRLWLLLLTMYSMTI
jgi:hypothetical protein